jgi:predicted dehydrogenase
VAGAHFACQRAEFRKTYPHMTPPPDSAIRIGLIGCGYWGPNYLRVFSQLDGAVIAAAAESDATRREKIAKAHPNLQIFASHHELLASDKIDAVVVAVPTARHFTVASDALLAGRHVLCEKPLCTSVSDGEELLRLAQEHGRTLMVGHIFLFNPGLLHVHELVTSGALGQLRYMTAMRTNLGPVRSDVNAVWDLASHDIAIFNWLTGAEPGEVTAVGASYLQPGVEDMATITLRYPGNVLATSHCSWLDPRKVRRMTIVGSQRMITWDDLNLSSPVAVYEKGGEGRWETSDYGDFLRVSLWEGDVRLPKIPFGEPLKAEAAAFLEAIRSGRAPRSDGEFGLSVVRVLEKIEARLRQP